MMNSFHSTGEMAAKDVDEQLQHDLAESEQLLEEIAMLTKDQAPDISQYRQFLEATDRTLETLAEGLTQSNNELDTVADMTTRCVSLELQSKGQPTFR